MARDKLESYLPLTESTFYILLALQEPLHGYAIMQAIEVMSDGAVRVGPGTLYGALSNLEKEKLVAKAGQEQRRKIYALTPKGANVFRLQLDRLDAMSRLAHEALDRAPGRTMRRRS
jgi:DNA-binding PadR family transcriptional regulator